MFHHFHSSRKLQFVSITQKLMQRLAQQQNNHSGRSDKMRIRRSKEFKFSIQHVAAIETHRYSIQKIIMAFIAIIC